MMPLRGSEREALRDLTRNASSHLQTQGNQHQNTGPFMAPEGNRPDFRGRYITFCHRIMSDLYISLHLHNTVSTQTLATSAVPFLQIARFLKVPSYHHFVRLSLVRSMATSALSISPNCWRFGVPSHNFKRNFFLHILECLLSCYWSSSSSLPIRSPKFEHIFLHSTFLSHHMFKIS